MKRKRITAATSLLLAMAVLASVMLVGSVAAADTASIGTTWLVQSGGAWTKMADGTLKCDTTGAIENKISYNDPAVLTGDTVVEFDLEMPTFASDQDFVGFYLSGAADNAYWGLIVQLNQFGYVPLGFNGATFDYLPGAGSAVTAGYHHFKVQILRPANTLSIWMDSTLLTDSYALAAASTYDHFGFVANAKVNLFDFHVKNVLLTNGASLPTMNFQYVTPPTVTPTSAATATPTTGPTSAATATPTTHSTPTPVPTRAPVIGVNWFAQPNPDSGDWTETSLGYLHAKNIGTSKVTSIACVPPDFTVVPAQSMPKDLTVEFDVKVPDASTGGWSGFYVRANAPQSGTDGYLVFMSTAGLNVLDNGATTFYTDPIRPELFTANAWHHVKISAIGTKLNVWVNGTQVITDKTIATAARAGNFFGASCVNYNADYKNMTVTADTHVYHYFDYIAPATNPDTGDAGTLLALLALASSAGTLVVLRRKGA